MRRFVAGENIRRYRQMLASETDEARRRAIERLLAEEVEIWAGLVDPEDVDPAETNTAKQKSK